MKKILLTIVIPVLFCSFLQDNNLSDYHVSTPEDSVTIVFAGDIMGHSPQFQAAYNAEEKTYNYDICFNNIKPFIESADLAVANLEVTFAGAPYSGYPGFSSPDELADGLKTAGYDILQTANNHIYDKGKAGMERTLKVLENRQLKYLGSYKNQMQRDSLYPLIVDVKGVRFAFLNYTYGTNNSKIQSPNIVNYIDTVLIKKDIQKAKLKNSDFIIFTVHWGAEYKTSAGPGQRNLARMLSREGVSLIIGAHPHVIEDAETLETNLHSQCPVFYSLGNSISNQREIDTNGGLMVKATFSTKYKSITNTTILPVYVHKGILNGKYQYHLIPTSDYITHPGKYNISGVDSLSLIEFDKRTRERIPDFNVDPFFITSDR